jgi:hypothetical protein
VTMSIMTVVPIADVVMVVVPPVSAVIIPAIVRIVVVVITVVIVVPVVMVVTIELAENDRGGNPRPNTTPSPPMVRLRTIGRPGHDHER